MVIPIVFFSSSNNTKYVAQTIAEGIKSQGLDADLIPIEEVQNHAGIIQGSPLIAVGTPIYGGFAEPILEWMRSTDFSHKKVYLFSTAAFVFSGSSHEAVSIIRKAGGEVLGVLEVKFKAPGDGIYLLGSMARRFPLQEDQLRRAFSFGQEIAGFAEGVISEMAFRPKWMQDPVLRFLGRVSLSLVRLLKVPALFIMKHLVFQFDFGKCSGCRLCERVCPTNAITIPATENSRSLNTQIRLKPDNLLKNPSLESSGSDLDGSRQGTYSKNKRPLFRVQPISFKTCIACFRCFKVCPTKALKLRWGKGLPYYQGPWQLEGYIEPSRMQARFGRA